jgi:hypothetical protein
MQATVSGTPVAVANNGTYTAGGGSNRVVLFAVSFVDNDAGTTVTGITFGGVAAHFIGRLEGDTLGINRPHVEWWYLKESDSIPTGSQTVTVSYSVAPVSTRVHCFTVQDANQAAISIEDLESSDATTSLTASFSSISGSVALAAMTAEHHASNTNTTWTGFTEVTDGSSGAPSQRFSAAYKNVTTGATESVSAAVNVPVGMVLVAASVKSAALFDDDFASGDKSHTENGVAWHGAGVRATVVDDLGNSSGKALRMRYPARGTSPEGNDAWSEQRFYLGPLSEDGRYNELWIKYRVLIPSNFELTDPLAHQNDKWLRLWSRGPDFPDEDGYSPYYFKGGFSMTPLATPGQGARIITEFGGDVVIEGPPRREGRVGRWDTPFGNNWITSADLGQEVEYVMRVKTDTSGTINTMPAATGGNGALQAWKNGVLIASQTGLRWRTSDGLHEYFEYGYIFGYSNCGYAQQTDFFVRQVTIATSNIFGVS